MDNQPSPAGDDEAVAENDRYSDSLDGYSEVSFYMSDIEAFSEDPSLCAHDCPYWVNRSDGHGGRLWAQVVVHYDRPSHHFYIVAPQKRQVLDDCGHSCGLLFSGRAPALVQQLVVPVLPPGFGLLDADVPENQESRESPGRRGTKRYTGTDVGNVAYFLSYAKPKAGDGSRTNEHRRPEDCDEAGAAPLGPERMMIGSESRPAATLSDMPREVHDLVFHHLDLRDVYHFGFTSHYFWNVARVRLRSYYASFYGQWAGQMIAGIWSRAARTDLPTDLLTENEKDELEQAVSESDKRGGPRWKRIENLAGLARRRFEILHAGDDCPFYNDVAAKTVTCRPPHPGMVRTMAPTVSDFFPEDREWVLRNLTSREYVRSRSIAFNPGSVWGPWMARPGFGEVLLSRICWCREPSDCVRNLHAGVWAGHRFDITTMDRFVEWAEPEHAWKDVGEEVAKEIGAIWEREYGSNWKELMGQENWDDEV